MLRKLPSALLWILVFQFVGYLLGRMTRFNIETWYQTLHKSSLNPPEIVFPIVWGVLYVMIALAGWWLWQHRDQTRAKVALVFYGIQVLMNWAWTPIFFQFHQIQLSFYWIVGLLLVTLATIIITWNKFKFATIMLIPYWLWLVFACYLNGVIWLRN
jgi:translocator protein